MYSPPESCHLKVFSGFLQEMMKKPCSRFQKFPEGSPESSGRTPGEDTAESGSNPKGYRSRPDASLNIYSIVALPERHSLPAGSKSYIAADGKTVHQVTDGMAQEGKYP
jgi:hypothetical protein